jgi:hypothetical protein
MMTIAAGTRVEFDVRGSVGEWLPRTVDDVRQGATNFMSAYVTVESIGLSRTDNAFWREYWDWGYTANVRIRTRYSHASIDDLLKIVADGFQSAAGEIPTVTANGYTPDQGTSYQPGGTQEPSSTGQWMLFGLAAIAVAVFVLKRG